MLAILFQAQGVPTGPIFGLFCAVAAVMMGMQTFQGFKEGWAYNGRTSRVYNAEQPLKYRVWLAVQIFFVVFLASLSIYAFIASIVR